MQRSRFLAQLRKSCTERLKGFYHCLKVVACCFEFYADSLFLDTPDYFACDLDWLLLVGKRKGQCNLLSREQGFAGFNEDSSGTYVRDEVFEGTIQRGVCHSGGERLSGMSSSVGSSQLFQQVQKSSLLVIRRVFDERGNVVEQLLHTIDETGLIGLSDWVCHSENRTPNVHKYNHRLRGNARSKCKGHQK